MSIDVGCLIEQMVLQLPDNELKKRLSGAGLGKDEVEKIMGYISNSRLKYSSEKSEDKKIITTFSRRMVVWI